LAEVASAVTVNHAATPEQFATLFVTVARSLGVAARLVTGFRVAPGAGGIVPAGTTTVTNRQGWTWAEIPVVGMGWVVVDPTPAATTAIPTPPASAKASATTTTTTPAQNAVPAADGAGHALAPPVKVTSHRGDGLSSWWIVGFVLGGMVGLVSLVFACVALRRALRRVRRRRGPPPGQAVGAWMDVLDALARAGADPGAATTTREVADLTGRSFGPDFVEPVRRVGGLADRAIFSAGASPDSHAAQAAWSTAVDFGRDLRHRLAPGQRIRGALRVGILRGPRAPALDRNRDRGRDRGRNTGAGRR
jgi:hypothetical protein